MKASIATLTTEDQAERRLVAGLEPAALLEAPRQTTEVLLRMLVLGAEEHPVLAGSVALQTETEAVKWRRLRPLSPRLDTGSLALPIAVVWAQVTAWMKELITTLKEVSTAEAAAASPAPCARGL